MSYTPDFTRKSLGKFNDDLSIVSLVQGSYAYRVEDEFNEEAWLHVENMRRLIRALSYSGLVTGNHGDYGTCYKLNDAVFAVDGLLYTLDSSVSINYPSFPSNGTLNSLVFLEFWVREVSYADTLYKRGQFGGTVVENSMLDERVASLYGSSAETTRRVVLEYQPRIVSGVNFSTYPNGVDDPNVSAKYKDASPSGICFVSAGLPDDGLYRASNTGFGVLEVVYALPIAKVVQSSTGSQLVTSLVRSRVLEPVSQELVGDVSTNKISFKSNEIIQNDSTGYIEIWSAE